MYIEIKNRFTGKIILCGEYESIKDCLEKNNRADLSGANLSGANLSRAQTSGANLSRAQTSGADLSRANLSRAQTSWANLSGADLSGANLLGADLSGAKGIKLPIITISGSMHSVYYHNGKIRIGCEDHTIAKWKKDYKKIGKDNNYTDEQIAEYKRYIDACSKLWGA
jgi:hypothetical protein